MMRVIALLSGVCTACGGGTAATSPRAGVAPREPVAVIVSGGAVSAERIGEHGASVVTPREPEVAASARASAMLERGRTLYRDLAFEQSLAAVGEAQVVLEREPRTEEDFAALHRALTYRAMNELALGREENAREALRRAVALAPDAALDEGAHPPDVRALYETIRTEARAEAPVAISVTTEPPAASVSLDGREVGITPATVHATPGVHYVRLAAAGHASRVMPVAFGADTAPLSVSLPRADAAEAAAQVLEREPSAIGALPVEQRTALARALGATRVLRVERAGSDRWTGALLDLDTGATRTIDGRSDDPNTAIAAMLGELDPAGPGATPPPEDEGGLFAEPAFWVVATVVVLVGAGIGAYFLLRDPGHEVVLR